MVAPDVHDGAGPGSPAPAGRPSKGPERAAPGLTPVEPAPSRWAFEVPPRHHDTVGRDEPDLVAVGADLLPGTILAAYRAGLFPMGIGPDGAAPVGWWSPDPRGVLDPARVRVSRSLRRARRTADVTLDADFSAVVRACADPSREGRWITRDVHDAYLELHRLGWAHSIEVWRPGGGRRPVDLAGGLYGLAVGGLFAGESMFHRVTDVSKVALVALCEVMTEGETDVVPRSAGDESPGVSVVGDAPGDPLAPAPAAVNARGTEDSRASETPRSSVVVGAVEGSRGLGKGQRLIDVQWLTPHLASLGAVEVPRAAYLGLLPALVSSVGPSRFRSEPAGQDLREPDATPPR